MLTAWFEDSYSALVASGVAEVLRERGGNLICFVGGRPGTPWVEERGANRLYDLVGPATADGLVLMSSALMHFASEETARDFCTRFNSLPMVSIGMPLAGIPGVIADGRHGLRTVLRHLIEVHGRRRIGFIRGPEASSEAAARFDLFRELLAEYGIAHDPSRVAPGSFEYIAGEEAVALLLDERRLDLDALVASNDSMALAALEALRARGVRVPEELSIVGFDDTEAARFATPPLTTVRQPLQELGRTAARLLLAQLEGHAVPAYTELRAEAVVRESCGCLRTVGPVAEPRAEHLRLAWPAVLRNEHTTVARLMTDAILSAVPFRPQETAPIAADEASGVPVTVRADFPRATGASAPSACECNTWVHRILDGFESDVAEDSRKFLSTLDSILGESAAYGADVWEWHRVISALRSWALPRLVHDRATRNKAESLLFHARDLISDKAQRREGDRRLASERRARSLNDLGRRLIEADDFAHTARALDTVMEEIGLRAGFVALYNSEGDDLNRARLVLVKECDEPMEHRPDEASHDPRELIANTTSALHRPFALVAEPLYVRDEPIGFGLFDCQFEFVTFYDVLRQQLSSTLKRLQREAELGRLHQLAKQRSQELELAYTKMRNNQQRLIFSEKTAALGRLTAGMAHEMNTPLAAVRIALQELGKLAAEYRASLADIHVTVEDHHEIAHEIHDSIRLGIGAADRVAGFVHGIRFQTPEAAPQDRCRFDAVPVIQDTLLLLQHALRGAGCSMSFEPAAPRIDIHGSPGHLAQVVTNLVTNAIDASRPTGGGLITIRLAPSPGRVTLSVTDRGSGIAPENVQRIFDPMFTTKPFGQGTGLGLSIVHNIVANDFRGTIDVKSELGVGTTFILSLMAPPQGAQA